jgi:hypothetical protein
MRSDSEDCPSSATASSLPSAGKSADGRAIGLSTYSGYTVSVGSWSSLAMIDEAEVKDGREVAVVRPDIHHSMLPSFNGARPYFQERVLLDGRRTVVFR